MSLENDVKHSSQMIVSRIEAAKYDLIVRINALEASLAWSVKDSALREAIRVLSKDMHTASTRPCSTCQLVSNALGEPFGCVARAEKVGR